MMTTKKYAIAFYSLLRKEVLRFTRIWVQTILPPVITTGLYLLIFGGLMGDRIGRMEGYGYMEFIVPGVIMLTVITNSYSNVVSSFFSAKFQRSIEELLISPLPNWLILAGFVGGGVVRGLLVGLAVSLVSLTFVDIPIKHVFVMLLVVFLTSALFATAGLVNAIYAKTFDDITIIPTFILTPLTYLGGIFYSIKLLPEFWQDMSLFNPILYMVNVFRYGFLGVSDINHWYALGIIFIFWLALTLFALHLLKTGKGIKA
jgi:ABC-2 type transport system permease protein